MIPAKLHMITGGDNFGASLQAAAQAAPWVDYIHLRNKAASAREMEAWALRLLQDGVPAGKLVINDRVDVALAVGACGVQLASHSLRPSTAKNRWPHLLVGVSVHTPQEAAEAFAEDADYVLFGHIYDSASKPGLPPRGLHLLEETVRLAGNRPVIALGGIQPAHVPGLLRVGAAGYAVLSGIGGAADPAQAARAYCEAALKEVIPHEADD
jgi:thiazole tautomerase (transcriptional regulator TenI)